MDSTVGVVIRMFILDDKYSGMGCIYATVTLLLSTVNDHLETSIRYCCIQAVSMLNIFVHAFTWFTRV